MTNLILYAENYVFVIKSTKILKNGSIAYHSDLNNFIKLCNGEINSCKNTYELLRTT